MVRTMESIKEYLWSCHGVVKALLADIIRKTILDQTHGDYPTYATPDNEVIARMLHLTPDKNKHHSEKYVQKVYIYTAE